MDVKDILKLATNPLVVGALGAYLAREKLGKEYGTVITVAGGGLAGAIAGSLVQKYLLGVGAPAPAPVQQQLPVEGVGRVNFDFSQPPALPAPRPAGPGPVHDPSAEGVFAGTSYDTGDGAAADAAAAEAFGRGGYGDGDFN